MDTRENKKCIEGEISFEDRLNEKRMKDHHKKKMHTKHVNSNLNLKLSIFIFLVMAITALVIVLNKGKFGDFSLIYLKDKGIHTAELECENYYLSIIDNEAVDVVLTIDGIEKDSGYTLASSDNEIARIEDGKVVAGEKAGTATIVAYYEEYDMTISTDILTYIPINTIFATITSSKLTEGQEAEISISIIPDDGTDDFITYSSSDKAVATVNEDGVVTGLSEGEAIITIKDELTGASATKTVTVK